MEYLVARIAEPFLSPALPQQRIYWLYLATALLIALASYAGARDRAGGISLKSFLRYCLPKSIYLHRSARVDYVYFIVNRVLFMLLFAPALAGLYLGASSIVAESLGDTLGGASRWWTNMAAVNVAFTVASVIAMDLGLYVAHYLQHKIPALWEFHKVHHSAEVLTPATAYRMHPVDDVLAIGLSGLFSGAVHGLFTHTSVGELSMITIMELNALLFAFYFLGYNLRHSHVWVSYGPVASRIFISPAQHQIHHSNAPRHFDRNFGFIFAAWDGLFGTLYVPRVREDIEYGLGEHETREFSSIARLYLLPFRKNMNGAAGKLTAILVAVILAELLVNSVLMTKAWLATPSRAQEAQQVTVAQVAPNRGPVMIEDLTWTEVRELIQAGHNVAIIPTGGTEQNGPHVVLGKHNHIMRQTSEQIARRLGNALVAPVIAYVPEGDIDPPSGHMRYAGTLTVSQRLFEQLLESTARSLKTHRFRIICFIGDSGGNQAGQERVANKLAREWEGSGVRVLHVSDYYSRNHQVEWLKERGESTESIGTHAGIRDTSEMLAAHAAGVRIGIIAAAPLSGRDGVDGDPLRASAERGQALLDLKIAAAVRQIEAFSNSPAAAHKAEYSLAPNL
jgi:sterol desaturase/sphingolipid hydroxylase (fatty acid hydroxylase superfamily)/creatinine amidohydrolase/Fe(II)-dependent formamide hydrolase-like protein